MAVAKTNIRFTLQYKVAGELTDARTWTTSAASIGLPSRLGNRDALHRGPAFQLPPEMLSDLERWFTQETDGRRPLWVHLVRPYRALRLVPWERLLLDAVQVPILMLPDFIFPPPLEAKDLLDVAICGSAPLGHEEHSVVGALARSVAGIVRAAPRRLRIHVFTDRDIAARLPGEPAWPTGTPEAEILVHDSAGAEKYVVRRPIVTPAGQHGDDPFTVAAVDARRVAQPASRRDALCVSRLYGSETAAPCCSHRRRRSAPTAFSRARSAPRNCRRS